MTRTAASVATAVFGPRAAVASGQALVLSPVTPRWDEGAFFTPVIDALTGAGLRVTVVDTLSLWDEGVDSMAAFSARWSELLPRFGPIDVLCGNALGGAVAQSLLTEVDPATAVLLVSGPTRTDTLLESRLGEIADLAATGRPGEALTLLNQRVLPSSSAAVHSGGPTADADESAGRRLAAGMRLLCGIDLSPRVLAHPGPLLHIVGSHSQLVTQRHTTAAAHHKVHVVPGTGMRPHFESTAHVSALIGAFLRKKGLQ